MARKYLGPRIAMTLRIPPLLHGQAVRLAAKRGQSFTEMGCQALAEFLERELGEAYTEPEYRANLTVYDEEGRKIGKL